MLVVALQLRHHDIFGEEAAVPENVDKPKHLVLIGDAEVGADLLTHNIARVEADDNLHLIFDAVQHGDLVIRSKPRQHARRMMVIKELAAHLQVELAADFFTTSTNVLRLQLDVLLAVKTHCVRHARNPTAPTTLTPHGALHLDSCANP